MEENKTLTQILIPELKSKVESYVDDKIGDIDALLTRLDTGEGV